MRAEYQLQQRVPGGSGEARETRQPPGRKQGQRRETGPASPCLPRSHGLGGSCLSGKQRGGEASTARGARLLQGAVCGVRRRDAGQSLLSRAGGAQDVGTLAGQGSALSDISSPP